MEDIDKSGKKNKRKNQSRTTEKEKKDVLKESQSKDSEKKSTPQDKSESQISTHSNDLKIKSDKKEQEKLEDDSMFDTAEKKSKSKSLLNDQADQKNDKNVSKIVNSDVKNKAEKRALNNGDLDIKKNENKKNENKKNDISSMEQKKSSIFWNKIVELIKNFFQNLLKIRNWIFRPVVLTVLATIIVAFFTYRLADETRKLAEITYDMAVSSDSMAGEVNKLVENVIKQTELLKNEHYIDLKSHIKFNIKKKTDIRNLSSDSTAFIFRFRDWPSNSANYLDFDLELINNCPYRMNIILEFTYCAYYYSELPEDQTADYTHVWPFKEYITLIPGNAKSFPVENKFKKVALDLKKRMKNDGKEYSPLGYLKLWVIGIVPVFEKTASMEIVPKDTLQLRILHY